MAKAKYNTALHKQLEVEYAKQIAQGQGWCTEPICLAATRFIPPGTPRADWHVPHNPDGVTYRGGPAHARCNTSEGGRRRHHTPTRWEL
jgi:hypothetical protein